jgi:hypothetical protein
VALLFEDLSSVEQGTGTVDATPEGQTLSEVLNEIDDIARATLGSITIATMRKLIDRRETGRARPRKPSRRTSGASRAPELRAITLFRGPDQQ